MLKVALCKVGRTVVRRNFFGLMGYYYFVQLRGYASRAASSAINSSTFRKVREKSGGAGNIRNISALAGYKEGFVTQYRFFTILKKISIHIFSIFTNSFSVFKLKDFKRSMAVGETASQYGVFLVLTIFRLCSNTPIRTSV